MSDSQIINPEESPNNNKLRYSIPDILIGYGTILDYLPISIGSYQRHLPEHYFKNVFKDSKHSISVSNKSEYFAYKIYNEKIFALKTIISLIINRYKEQVKERNILEDHSLFKEESHAILDKLNRPNNSGNEPDENKYIIKYLVTYPHPKIIKNNGLIYCIDEDIKTLLSKLYEVSLYANNIRDDELNSFKRFCENIIIHMRANLDVKYPKSIVNYSCFMYNIIGYPCCTPSRRIYSINNNTDSDNKFDNIIIYMKNTDALISYLYDIRFRDKADPFIQEEWILRVAYCICIALLSYRSEYTEYQYITENIFKTRNEK
jgi:hypothetical protein